MLSQDRRLVSMQFYIIAHFPLNNGETGGLILYDVQYGSLLLQHEPTPELTAVNSL